MNPSEMRGESFLTAGEERNTDEKRRKRTLREELLAFLEKLKPWCGRFDTLEDWWEFLRPLDNLLERARDDLTPEQYRRLKRYVQWTETGREALSLACKSLSRELAAVAQELAAASGLGSGAMAQAASRAAPAAVVPTWVWGLLAGLVLLGGLVAGTAWAVRAWLHRPPVQVRVESRNCAAVEPPRLSPDEREAFRTLGIPFPQEPLTPQHPWVFQLPSQMQGLEILFAHQELRVTVHLAGGVAWTWTLPWTLADSTWTLNGRPLEPGRPVRLDLTPGQTVHLVVTCR